MLDQQFSRLSVVTRTSVIDRGMHILGPQGEPRDRDVGPRIRLDCAG